MESEVKKNSFNRTFASGRKLVFLPLFVFLGFIVIIAIVIVKVKSDINEDNFGRVPIIIGVCFGLVFLMIILLSVLQCRRMAQLRQTIAEESARYSSRSTPCSWRLETTRFYTGNFENRKTETTYHIIIDIGRGQSAYTPPSYQALPNPTCRHCGAMRIDTWAKFCSSCGRAFK